MAAVQGGKLAGARLPWLLAVLSLLATAVWVIPVMLSRGHGFDVSDEGAYVLAYRWWDSNPRNFTGAQYLYGPVFEALGNSIPGLRVTRLASVLATHAVFGWAFMSWLRTRYPDAVPSRGWVVAGVTAIIAVGGVTYGWLPLSPGYDDVITLGCLAVMAVCFRCWRSVLRSGRLPLGPALALPFPVVAMVLAKWSSAAVVLFFVGVLFLIVVVALRPAGWGRFVAVWLAGTAGVVLLFDVLVVPLGTVVPPMVEVSRLAAGSSHAAGSLLNLYVTTAQGVLGRVGTLLLVVAVLALAGAGLARTEMRPAARWVGATGPIVVVGLVAAASASLWPVGGRGALDDYSAGLLAITVAAAVASGLAAVWSERRGDRPRKAPELPAVLAMLLLVPVVQAVGSYNSLSSLAVNLGASWFAFVLLGVALTPPATRSGSFLLASAAATLVLCVSVGADGVLRHPYGTTAYDSSDRALGGTGTLGAVAMPTSERRQLDAVRQAMAPDPPGRRPVVVLDDLAGLVLLTEGRLLGEPWNSALFPERLAAGIKASCRDQSWTTEREPIVLAWRPVPKRVTDALDSCGVRLDHENFREVRLPFEDRSIRIYTPLD